MWKTFLVLIMLAPVCVDRPDLPGGGPAPPAAAPQRGAELIVPLEGLDPVLLTRGKEAQGDEQFSVSRGRFRYLFAGAETKAAFEREPARYEIQLGGACARMGPTVRGNPDLFTVHAGRIYVFGSPACLKAFKEKPDNFLEADEAAAAPASEESRRRGLALVEKAVEAAGGAARVDGVVSYEERGTTGTRTPQGAVEVKTVLLVLYPDKVRLERTFPFGTLTTVVTRAGGFTAHPNGASEMPDGQRAAYEKQFRLGLLTLLRARRAEGFTAAAAGEGKAGEARVEQVEVAFGGLRVTLGIDPATGRVLSLAHRGRADDSRLGQIVRTFSDFRTVGGLTLPFKSAATFEGAPAPSLTSTVESIVVNGEVAPSLFERPKPAGGQ